MSVKTWILGVVVVLLGALNAGLVFSMFESRFLAGMFAGAGFILVGGYLMALVWSHEKPFLWCSFYTSHFHLFLISLPMVAIRALNSEVAFEDLSIMGLSGPVFHEYSRTFYQLMLLGVVVDTVRFYFMKKRAEVSAGQSTAVSEGKA